jgi:ATP-binding cassette, subfamily B, bacterial
MMMKVLKFLIDLITYRPWLYLINLFVWIIIQTLPILPGLAIKEFFDSLSNEALYDYGPWIWIIVLLLLTIARIIFVFLGNITDTTNRYYVSTLLRKNLLVNSLNNISLKKDGNESLTYFRDDVDIVEDALSWTLDLIGKLIFAIISFIILFHLNPEIVFFVFIPLIVIIILIQRLTNLLNLYRQKSRKSTETVTTHLNELISNYETISYSNSTLDSNKSLKVKNNERKKWMVKDGVLTEILSSTSYNTVNIGTGVILLILVFQTNEQAFNVGNFALFVYYLTFVSDFTMFFGKFLTQYKQTNVSYERLLNFTKSTHNRLVSKKLALKMPFRMENLKQLNFKNLSYHFDHSNKGIKDISFNINKGTLNIINGSIGAGKTTLLKSMLGIHPLKSGEISWNGHRVNIPEGNWPPKNISYTPQNAWIFSENLKENITLGSDMNESLLTDILNKSLLLNDVDNFGNQLEKKLGTNGGNLSGGQLSRLSLARTLFKDSEVLIIDDIFNSLDIETQNEVWKNLLKMGKTIIAVSSNRFALENADQILVLNEGQLTINQS